MISYVASDGRRPQAADTKTNSSTALAAIALHLVGVRHVYPGGFLVHHLFFGILIALPAAFLLAFSLRSRLLESLSLLALGIGSALILDEVTYLVATQGTDADNVSRISLFGALAFISAAVILLLVIYWLHRE